ncbi:MAG: hypothetical protein FWE32_10110 [Oscillospiraceae bacterium]|nr:hypothetical protein [Oscillospiraceae bacterium]
MSDKPIFKSTMFGGFERQSVLNYIYEEVSRNQEIQETLTAQIEAANAAKEKAEQAAAAADKKFADGEAEVTAARNDLSKAKGENAELTSMIDGLNKEIARQEAIVAEKEELLRKAAIEKEELLRKADAEREEILREADLAKAGLEQRIVVLEQKNAELEERATHAYDDEMVGEKEELLKEAGLVKSDLEARIAELEQINAGLAKQIDGLPNDTPGQTATAAEFEKVKLQIGDLMIRSHIDSERILEDARVQARQITGQADEEARQTIDAAHERSREIEEEANRSAQDISNQISAFRADIAMLEEKVEQSMMNMRDKFAAIGDAISQSEDKIGRNVPVRQSEFF